MQTMKIIRQVSNLTIGTTRICEFFVPNSVYTQCVRWKRKPIWLPPTKNKQLRIPVRPVIPAEEKLEIQQLYNKYRTYMHSLRYFLTQNARKNKRLVNVALLKRKEEDNFQSCNAINDKWNAKLAKEREVRLAREAENREEEILQELEKRDQQRKKLQEEADMAIIKAKTEAPTFITAENIDKAIEECFANTVNHNRAVDLEGNWYDGKYPPSPTSEKAKEEIVHQQ